MTSKKMMQIEFFAKIYCNLFFFFFRGGCLKVGESKKEDNENNIKNSAEKTVISKLV